MKRSILWIGLVVMVFLLLAGGAYTAVQLLAQPQPASVVSGGGRVIQSVQRGSDGAAVSVRTTILPAAELPDEQAAASGIVLGREDDALTVGTGDIELAVEVQVDGSSGQERQSVVPSTNGPQLEVLLTRDTQFFRDVTDIAAQQPDDSGEVTVVQEVQPVVDSGEIQPQMEVQVWGRRRGERIVADVVVFGPLAGGALQ